MTTNEEVDNDHKMKKQRIQKEPIGKCSAGRMMTTVVPQAMGIRSKERSKCFQNNRQTLAQTFIQGNLRSIHFREGDMV